MNYLYEIRKKLHKVPEIAFNEFKTQEVIMYQLKDCKNLKLIKFEPTGLLYEYSQGEGEYLMFRADMDALPIAEKTNCDFQSEHIGISHSCGHDIHMTILIGLIHHVVNNNLKKNILFLFQPAEEGHGGAVHIINTGIFDRFKIKAAYALHVTGQFPTGSIGVKSGIIFGIPQEFDVQIQGKSGHVATPHKGRDAFLAGLSFISDMNSLLQKRFPAQEPIIFHVGKVAAGNVRNIIPDLCVFEGTVRCLKKEVKIQIIDLMFCVGKSLELSHDVLVNISLLSSYDPVVNDKDLTKHLIKNIPDGINVIDVEYSLTGEDFGFFSELFPIVLFWLGTDAHEDLHSNRFLPDEKSIDVGLKVLKEIVNKS